MDLGCGRGGRGRRGGLPEAKMLKVEHGLDADKRFFLPSRLALQPSFFIFKVIWGQSLYSQAALSVWLTPSPASHTTELDSLFTRLLSNPFPPLKILHISG